MNTIQYEKPSGVLPSPPDKRDRRFYTVSDMVTGSVNFPRKYAVSWLPDIKDQLQTNSCTAFALSYIFQCIYKKVFGESISFSTGYLYGNRRATEYDGQGQIMRDAIKAASKYGDVFAAYWDNNLEVPDAINAFEQNFNLLNQSSKKCIKSYIRLYDMDEARAHMYKYDLPLFVNTRMNKINPLIKSNGLHAIICTEYTWDKFFICQNSWGKNNCPHPKLRFDDFEEIWGVVPMEEIKFKDVTSERWSAGAIQNAVNDGIIAGFPDGTYAPDKSLTREQIAVIWERIKLYCETHYEKKQ